MENTKPSYGSMDLYDVWTVDREGEAKRFAAHDKLTNRKLLWHGTNGGKWLYGSGPSIVPVWYAPANNTGTISGNRHYSAHCHTG